MQPTKLPTGSFRIRLFTGATATAVESAVNGFLKSEDVSLVGVHLDFDGTAPVVMLVHVPRELSQGEAQTQQWP